MDDRPAWEDSGERLPQDGNGKHGKHGRLEDLGPAGPGWHWSGHRA